jgi:hypothetical protein
MLHPVHMAAVLQGAVQDSKQDMDMAHRKNTLVS